MVFISYTTADDTVAESVRAELEKNGIDCWIATKSIPAGANYITEIVSGIKKCDAFVLVLSESSQASEDVFKEITIATKQKKRIFAIHIDNSDLTGEFEYMLGVTERIELCDTLPHTIDKLVTEVKKFLPERLGFKATVSDKIGIDDIGVGLICYISHGILKEGETVLINGKRCKVLRLTENGKDVDSVSAGMNAGIIIDTISYEEIKPGDTVFGETDLKSENEAHRDKKITKLGPDTKSLSQLKLDGTQMFISYTDKDTSWASFLKTVLKQNGMNVWMSPESIPEQSNYAAEVSDAIKSSDAVLLVASEEVQRNLCVMKELETAISARKKIVAVFVEDFEITDALDFYMNDVPRINAYELKAKTITAVVNEAKRICGR